MARLPRVVIPGYPHHVINRGNRRQTVFFSDEDKALYCRLLKHEIDEKGIAIWTYCLMDNHVHFVAVPETQTALAKCFGEVQRKYALTINIRNEWKGHLWQERFDSNPMDERYLYSAVRYIERNPVRAGIVKGAENYYWSSARAHVYRVKDELLSPCFLTSTITDWAAYLRKETDESDKKLIKSHIRTGRPLGNDKFIDELERISGRNLRKMKTGPKRRKG